MLLSRNKCRYNYLPVMSLRPTFVRASLVHKAEVVSMGISHQFFSVYYRLKCRKMFILQF